MKMPRSERVDGKMSPKEVFRRELRDGLHAYGPEASAALKKETLPRLPSSFLRKVALAKEILKVDHLHPKILQGIAVDDDDWFTRNNKTYPVTTCELRKLFDQGVIGAGTTRGFSACQHYDLKKDPPVAGLSKALYESKLCFFVGQAGVDFSFDVALTSDGFSSCHAAIIYDHDTSEAALLHIVHHDVDPGQLETVKEKWPHAGKREVIYIYGTASRRDYSRSLAKAVGATKVRTIKVATAACHWAVSYDPETNYISVVRKVPSDVLIYPGVSPGIYDKKYRANNNLAVRHSALLISATYRALRLPFWGNGNGELSETDLVKLTDQVNVLARTALKPNELKRFIARQELGFDQNGRFVVPAAFAKTEPEKETELKEIYSRAEKYGEIRFLSWRECLLFYHRLITRLGANRYLSDMFCTLIRRDGDEVGIIGGSSEISFRVTSDARSPLYRDILITAKKLLETTRCRMYFDSGLGTASDKNITIPHFSSNKEWEWIKEYRDDRKRGRC